MNKPIVILISAKAQHGKDSFADAFIKEAQDKLGFRCLRIKYGDFVKMVATSYYGWNGKKDEAGRELLQKLGTDLGRKNNPLVWISCVKEVVKALQTEYDFVLIPDCRFPNELDWQDTDFFTFTVRLNRKNEDGTDYINNLTEEQKAHPSEISLDDYGFNYVIENKNLEDIEFAAKSILDDILELDKE
jgi:hypothetical protein